MSGKIVNLEGSRAAFPHDRVTGFISLSRTIQALIPEEQWELDIWHVGSSFVTKGQNRDNRVLAFYNCETTLTNRQKAIGGLPLAGSVKEFAKAYVRYMHATSPVSFENTMKRLNALQFIEAGFRSLSIEPRIENLTVTVLNEAVNFAKNGVGPARHYQFALYIQQVHRFCLDRRFLVAPFQWKHGVRKPKDRTEEIGKDAKKWRDQKLPSPEAYFALAHIYRNAETFVDRLYSAMTAIFVAVPIRIHEVLQLRVDCEVFEKIKDSKTGEITDAYGIRVHPGKGNPPHVKWVPTQMASIVQEAIARIRGMCADAREVAAWYEKNPGELWLPADLEMFRSGDWLQIDRAAILITNCPPAQAASWIRSHGVEWRSDDRGSRHIMKEVCLSSLGNCLLERLPRDFPRFNGRSDQTYSETLALLFLNQAHEKRGTYRAVVDQVTVQSYDQWLSGHDGGKKPSVFDEWGFKERDGTSISITSHTFRHWLNTVGQLKGLSDLDIAKWSGREIQQNKAYNHVTPEETLSQIKAALDDGNGIGPMFEPGKRVGINRPVDRQEFMDAQIGAALTTELGICVHDYSLLPCMMHGDCLACSENVFVKGNKAHREKITKRLALSLKQLDDAVLAMGNGFFGADRWVQSHEASIAKMREIMAIHNDPAVVDGAVINLSGASSDGEVFMALRDRDETDGPIGLSNVEADILGDMWED